MALTFTEEQQIKQLIIENGNTFPIRSKFHTMGCQLLQANHIAQAIVAFTRGAAENGCVQCIY